METKYANFSDGRYEALNRVELEIPILCPHCGVSNNPINRIQGHNGYSNTYIAFFSHTCTACNITFFTIQSFIKTNDKYAKKAIMLAVSPSSHNRKFEERIETFSPRFVSSYNQAFSAEQSGNLDLAGMGYRAAEEILIKDFALKIIENGSPEKREEIAKLNLNNTIGKYFKDDQALLVSTDVVRINGNDYAHWDRSDDFDTDSHLQEQKAYLEIFINIVNTRLMIINPPVSREKH
ncbi:DUF4145 domain-containing protein [Paucilactobacillus kaifaensis]|uniref:DUF4145 domain-containing protein n=1 Tax=Paucilactobacillus kaifaensis TaxID=2559921 RepID=UPI0010F65C4A|nr:DUF4145 domain-containing protein [Paucilactobacillus kaifaensis]